MNKYKSFEEWLEDLGFSESSHNYQAVNPFGYIGKYQMGEGALTDTGYYKGPVSNGVQKWNGTFTGKDGVYNKQGFLNNHQAQENAMKEYKKIQWGYLKNGGADKYSNTEINGIKITPSGLLAAAHLVGHNDTLKYLRSNGSYIPKDGNGVSIERNLNKFAGYDVSEITDPNYYAPKFPETKQEKFDQILNTPNHMIQNITQKVNPPTLTIPNDVINKMPIKPPLSEEEWRKQLKRKRMGLL